MNEAALQKLEFDKIAERLAAMCGSETGKALAGGLRPLADRAAIERALDNADDARRFLSNGGRLGTFADASGMTAIYRELKEGLPLEPESLRKIANLFRLTSEAADKIRAAGGHYPTLDALGRQLCEDNELFEAIDSAIDEKNQVRDAASPQLREIRKRLFELERNIPKMLQGMFDALEKDKALQDRIVTVRNGRYVVPVRAEAASRMACALQDRSASGHTAFVEPLEIMEQNNRLCGCRIEERAEIERIMRKLTGMARERRGDIQRNEAVLGQIDLWAAKGSLSARMRGERPTFNKGERLLLRKARHPLIDGDPVPIDLELGGAAQALVISGPNAGGKTVALKTVGLLQLMAQSGLHIPADAISELPILESVEAVIGDEQSIELSLSTFTSHLKALLGALRSASGKSLALIDEICSGTDAEEGSSLAAAIIEDLLENGSFVLATTHQSHLKAFASATAKTQNARMAFDEKTQSPLFRLEQGAPGRSYAIEIAQRVGFPARLVEKASSYIDKRSRMADTLLAELEILRSDLEKEREAAQAERMAASQTKESLKRERDRIGQEKERLMDEALKKAEALIGETRRRCEELIDRARTAVTLPQTAALKGEVKKLDAPPPAPKKKPNSRKQGKVKIEDLKPDCRVILKGGGQEALFLAGPDRSGRVELVLGSLKMQVPLKEIASVEPPEKKGQEPSVNAHAIAPSGPFQQEIDIRGMRVSEAMDVVEDRLHACFMQGTRQVRIIHGYGEGALMNAVRILLGEMTLIASFKPGDRTEGGAGVTVAEFAN